MMDWFFTYLAEIIISIKECGAQRFESTLDACVLENITLYDFFFVLQMIVWLVTMGPLDRRFIFPVNDV